MIDMDRLPKHVALIMDGNGRWAKSRMLPRVAGHNAGMKSMREIVRRASDLGMEHLTVYAFSTENWKRTVEEVSGIFKLLCIYIDSDLRELHENNVKLVILGNYSRLPDDARERLDRSIALTANNTGLQFNICLNYGSRAEIADGVRAIAELVKAGELEVSDITEDTISQSLYTGINNVPDPELIIRTSGEERLSNFLMWQAAYSEFVFTDTLWPDFTPEEFEKCIEKYQSRDRRFGGRNK